jgi:hypothetical protein
MDLDWAYPEVSPAITNREKHVVRLYHNQTS